MPCLCGKAANASKPDKKATEGAEKPKDEVVSKTLLKEESPKKAAKVVEEKKEPAKEPTAEPALSTTSQAARVVEEKKEQAKEPMAEPPVQQVSRWCLVEHIMKEGADSETTSAWWARIAQMDTEAWTNMYKSNASKGLYNHWFLPMSKTEMYCLWELREGVSEDVLQGVLDDEVCSAAKNKIMLIDGNLNGGVYGFESKFKAGQDPEAAPPSNAVGEHCLYLVKHEIKPEEKEAWWKWAGESFADAEFGKKLAEYQAENQIANHAMFPISQDLIYCLWEAKSSVNKQAIVDVLGDNGMIGRGACVNTFLEYDSMLTGGACSITMKAAPTAVVEKEPASNSSGMPFFLRWFASCRKPEIESELEFDSRDD